MCPIRIIKKVAEVFTIKNPTPIKYKTYSGIRPVFDCRRGIEAPTPIKYGGSLEFSKVNPKDPYNTGIEVEYNDNPTEEDMNEFYVLLESFKNSPYDNIRNFNLSLAPIDDGSIKRARYEGVE